MLERLLSNHLEIGELTTAAYYIRQLEAHYQKAGDHRLVHFYETLGRIASHKIFEAAGPGKRGHRLATSVWCLKAVSKSMQRKPGQD